jgi:hypothetical protein
LVLGAVRHEIADLHDGLDLSGADGKRRLGVLRRRHEDLQQLLDLLDAEFEMEGGRRLLNLLSPVSYPLVCAMVERHGDS